MATRAHVQVLVVLYELDIVRLMIISASLTDLKHD